MTVRGYRWLSVGIAINSGMLAVFGGYSIIATRAGGDWILSHPLGWLLALVMSMSTFCLSLLLVRWRCPKCGKRFHGFSAAWPVRYCVQCGISLEELEQMEGKD
jgi:hypothetical protein